MSEAEKRKRKTDWQRKNRKNFAEKNGFSTASNYAVGGIRSKILKRDNYACVECQMTDKEHKKKWGRPITIDHKDKNRKNNSPSNLQTLCLRCHGSKDILPRLTRKLLLPFDGEVRRMREKEKTYQQIADRFNVSLSTVWSYFKGGLLWKKKV